MTPRWALRVRDSYPYGEKYHGDIVTLGNSTREQVEDIRRHMATGEHHEVVELDDAGNVVERVHNVVTTFDEGRQRNWCCDCARFTIGARLPDLPCPGVTT